MCGAKSCPPIKMYTPDNLEEGLNSAADAVCEGDTAAHMAACISACVAAIRTSKPSCLPRMLRAVLDFGPQLVEWLGSIAAFATAAVHPCPYTLSLVCPSLHQPAGVLLPFSASACSCSPTSLSPSVQQSGWCSAWRPGPGSGQPLRNCSSIVLCSRSNHSLRRSPASLVKAKICVT